MSAKTVISIYNRDDDRLVGTICLDCQQLTYTAQTSDLKNFLSENVAVWQQRKFVYPVISQKSQGSNTLTITVRRLTDISKPDYLDGLLHYLFTRVRWRVFKMKYYFV
ncbi:MAG TPA: hypothetical protein VF828_03590 [Patescibacteria group bacterium]